MTHLAKSAGALDHDALLLPCLLILRRHVQDAVSIDIERHFDLRHTPTDEPTDNQAERANQAVRSGQRGTSHTSITQQHNVIQPTQHRHKRSTPLIGYSKISAICATVSRPAHLGAGGIPTRSNCPNILLSVAISRSPWSALICT